ncbi:AAA family ATPase [Chromatocurvus halotolerans]|uniref:Putative secretion ATPase (PEP-CTERM system associated) n=1 Tax=Chromatocurvus halotolerans TaxID=1132028 RepID=A0A4V2SB68_9GAMM|nr:AAA family ATPase [Chromatocurvus halotolerans]TCO74330.1 putative secretion ATPase (PEP-CTERM system associated) [Chromatocurvus halotolerans]
MYDLYYRFTAEPFRLSPDHHFAFQHRGYKKARAYMAYAFMRAEGFVMVTGRPGTGKTTLVGALVDDLSNEKVTTANIVCSQLEANDLLQMVAYEFGVDLAIRDKGALVQHLSRMLLKWHREGRRALLIVDEAQDLSVSAMEELRLLTNIQAAGKPLLQIFLLGQPELRELILSPQMEQVHQRIVAASHLEALELDETEAYVRHRLSLVGWRGDPDISRSVYPLIYKFSEGVPRRINLICSRLLLHGSVEQLHRLGVSDMKEVLGELQGESLAAGNQLVDNDFQVDDVFEPMAARSPAQGGDSETTTFSPARHLRDVATARTVNDGTEDSTEPADDPEPGLPAEAPRATGTSDATPPAPAPEGSRDNKGPDDSGSAWRRRMRRNNRIF